jgi:uncharacterized protein (DUF427 family)
MQRQTQVMAMEQNVEAQAKPIKIPGPDHPITIERNGNRIMVTVAGRIIADTLDALTLREARYAPVQHIPRKDVDMTLLERTKQRPTAPTRATARISASRPAAIARPTPCGPTKRHMRR